MNVHLITKIARQVEGDRIMFSVIAGFTDKEKLKDRLKDVTYSPTETIDGIGYVVEVHVIEDVEIIE